MKPPDRARWEIEKMGPQNRNHTSKMNRFKVTGQKKRETKKWPKSQITRQKMFWELENGPNRSA